MPDVILPVLNEVAAIGSLVEAMPSGYRAIVVDNGSTDGSGQAAQRAGALVVMEPQRGFGAACWAGLQAATDEVVCFMDGDGSLDPAELPKVANPVLAGSADLMLGRRVAEAGAWPPHARLANAYLARRLRRDLGVPLRDIGPMRACRRAALIGLGLQDRRFGWPLEMVVLAARAGWRIDEVDVAYRARRGRSKVTGTVKGTARAVRDMSAILRRS